MNQDDVDAVVQTGEPRKFRPLHELLEEDGAILTAEQAMADFHQRLAAQREKAEIKR